MPSRPRAILGISFGHGDSSAALVIGGRLVAAAEEERFNRIKHYALFPTQAIKYCLRHAGIRPQDVAIVALAKKSSKHFFRRMATYWKHPELLKASAGRPRSGVSLRKGLKECGIRRARIFRAEHHYAHMLSARCLDYSEPMALLTLDGLGDFVSTSMGVSHGSHAKILQRLFFPHSLGYFYTAMTQYLGFPYYGDEFKVMGLSSYGTPRYLPALRDLIRETEGFGFTLNQEAFPILRNPIRFQIENGMPMIEPFYNASFLTQCLGLSPRNPKRQALEQAHCDLAKSVQCRFEEVADHLLQHVHAVTGLGTIGLAGGCAHNSVWVGKIPRRSAFKNVWVAPASHDAGIAVGAALAAWRNSVSVEGEHWGLLGPTPEEASEAEETQAPDSGLRGVREFDDEKALAKWMAERLAQGEIIGLAQGRLEFGPRALGSRSILADPRNPEMRDRLNQRVKHREKFRPFAASVQEEFRQEWFLASFPSPHMEAVFDVRSAQKAKIPSVVHADGTCRIQSVTRNTQPVYWELIEAFRQLTGVPMLINTSFNDSEPIVCSIRDAEECFKKSDLDHLVVGNKTVYSKGPGAKPQVEDPIAPAIATTSVAP